MTYYYTYISVYSSTFIRKYSIYSTHELTQTTTITGQETLEWLALNGTSNHLVIWSLNGRVENNIVSG